MVNYGPQKGPKTIIFPDALFFTLLLGFTDVVGRRSCIVTRGPIPKVLMMRWKKVLTSESPRIVDTIQSHLLNTGLGT